MNQENKQSKILTVILSIITALFIISISIAVPIVCRTFYYAHIEPLNLVEESGYSKQEIVQAYDEMMDFCVGLTDEFSTGVLPYSEEGKAHFVDVKGLFILDLVVALITSFILVIYMLIGDKLKVTPYRFKGRGFLFYGSAGVLTTFSILGVLIALFFEKAFVIFHKIFFPGKSNWIFNWYDDQIIRILPENFFRNCAILAIALIIIISIVLMILGSKGARRVS